MVTLYQEAHAALQESNFKPKKKLGQHFLIHRNVLETILRLVDLSRQDEVIEIGPGLGFLTRRLVEAARKVWAIEVDPSLVDWLQKSPLSSHPAFHLVPGDVLKIPLHDILPHRKVKLVANLPYNISTPVLFRLFELRKHFSLLVLMVQREVAERIAGSPGSKAYGTLSIWSQIHGQILDRVQVSPEAFFPRPRVKSTVLKFGLHAEPLVSGKDLPVLRGVVRASFGQRRKTLSNALGAGLKLRRDEVETCLRQASIDPRRRGETLSVSEFIRLGRALQTVLIMDS
ncbi:MAG: 16S rRNA (adenine(1518)-N(6)/adenine(1519)-N(6))-dimethyltransferase RsmA [Candidatus Binatia bacterium]